MATTAELAKFAANDELIADWAPGIRVPDPETILGMYRSDKALVELANSLREEHDLPSDYSLDVLWRKKGGKSRGGKLRMGKVQIVSDLAAFYGQTDVVIWLAADNCAELEYTYEQVKRELFHLLCSIDLNEKTLAPMVNAPDFAVYRSELEAFGLWRPELVEAAEAFKQAALL